MRKWVKILLWSVFSLILLIIAMLVGIVMILTPERLTPLTQDTANKILNADVSVDKVELSLRKSFPFLNLDVDRLVVRSRDILNLDPTIRESLPQWADTLVSVEHLHGGINVFKAVRGVIDLKDLELNQPQLNILVVNDSLNNFNISKPSSEEPDTTGISVPDIRLNRFSLISPKPVRYADIAQNTHITAAIESAELTNNTDTVTSDIPIYRIYFDSDVTSPLLAIIGQKDLHIGLDGIVEWNHNVPYQIGLKNFDFAVSELSGRINTLLDFKDNLTVQQFDVVSRPLSVANFLALVPDSIAKEYYIPTQIKTDANVNVKATLSKPYTLGSTELPFAECNLQIPTCYVKYDKLELDKFVLDADLYVQGGTIDDILIDVKKLRLEGGATELEIKGKLTELSNDPIFDGEIDGTADLSRMPDIVLQRLNASLKGKVTANTSIIARPSMFSKQTFHNLRLTGDVSVNDFMYIADDTLSMYHVTHTDMHFGTHERFTNRRGVSSDSLLSAKLLVDSVDILTGGIDIKVSHLSLGVGAQNKNTSADTTAIIPMGGRLTARSLSIFSISDTAGVRISDIRGSVNMRRYKNDAHLPQFNLNLGLGNLSTGNNRTRFMVSNGNLRCSLSKLPDSALTVNRREVRHLADSLHRWHPHLSVDSVYSLALQIRKRNSIPGHHRVHPELTSNDNEIIEWGTSRGIRRLLLDWDVKGSLTAEAARLFTASFPVRNRVENLNIKFNNDSIALSNVKYKAGQSDFLISGNVTNVKRAFTSRRNPSPLRINFSVLSDFIDVNELTHALITGSSHKSATIGDESADESTLDKNIDRRLDEKTEAAPLLIPTNIDAELEIKANSVVYSDIVLHNFNGTLLMYDGAINLHDLSASSDVGSINLTALYSAPAPTKIDFGFGMKLDDFNISNFVKLVPAMDSVMPMLHDLSGIVSANIALTSEINHNMDLVLPSMKAAINIKGDSVAFIDSVTFRKVAKWLLFKNKERNMIDHISAQMIVENGEMRLFPFIFDFDRYRLGIQGYNDFDMNLNYHIAVLKSPIPFKFGINVTGNYDKPKIRLGGAKFNESTTVDRAPIVNNTRINLINQFQNVFKRGVRNSKFATLDISDKPLAQDINLDTDTLTAADSTFFREQGLIP